MTSTDPATATDQGSMIIIENVFQRLLTSAPDAGEVASGLGDYKTDLAQDCSFTTMHLYTCTLKKKATFSNGHPVTSADVKFSIERAIRLGVPGSSAASLDSVRKIRTPDKQTVEFVLRRYDRQFGWALVGPAASIVDRTAYSPDQPQERDGEIIGSGPFRVAEIGKDRVTLARRDTYVGITPAGTADITVASLPDSSAVEDAMKSDKADLVWRGLTSAAHQRLTNQVGATKEHTTSTGFSQLSLAGARVLQLGWNPASKHRGNSALRRLVAAALQPDRILDSIVPPQIPGHRTSFPLGGSPKIKVSWTNRIPLTLAYDPSTPDGKDLANQLRYRLEDTGGVSVRLRPGDTNADLILQDQKAATPTALAWLQPFLADPLPASRKTVASNAEIALTADPKRRDAALTNLQLQAAKDEIVLPLTQQPETMFVHNGWTFSDTSFGPGWQLGLWGARRR